jgi:hypothetical protein
MATNQQNSSADLAQLRLKQKQQREKIHLLYSPFTTLKYFGIVSFLFFWDSVLFLLSHKKTVVGSLFIVANILLLYFLPGDHQSWFRAFEQHTFNAAYWVMLGVLSSVGLGTGLHTFVLYTGPFIARVTMAAWECGTVDFLTYGENSFICPAISTNNVSMWTILRKVQFEALLWGAGTAIGELPPYFVARAARLAGQRSKEMEKLEKELQGKTEEKQEKSALSQFLKKMRKLLYSFLGNLGFFGILLFASIPNPLFDLAGLTCGHFLVPFWTFFGATLIGKSFIKAHLQTIFIITMFSKQILSFWISLIESSLPFTKGFIDEFLEKERTKLHRPAGHAIVEEEKSLLAKLWDLVLILMVGYFLVSIINSSVQTYLAKRDKEELERVGGTQKNGPESKKEQ